ncbi:MAG TPA: outer membrane beta-barrel protein [Gemmatimonadales bacterium]|nr:outer membrane beta-barrel protein [Gemmatimonadales bacterium]
MTAVIVLCVLGGSVVAAQKPQIRKGFWIGFGFGYGSSNVSCDGCGSSNRESGATGFLKMGGTLSEKVLLGGEVNAWTKSTNGVTADLGNVSFAAYYYPQPKSGFFVKGGVGFATTRLHNSGSADANGFGFVAGLGYDIRVGTNISITPVGNFYFGSDGDLKESGTTLETGWKHNVYEFGLGITFH